MPRDVIVKERKPTAKAFLAAGDQAALRMVVALLREPPATHHWDFSVAGGPMETSNIPWRVLRSMGLVSKRCGSVGCAIGLTCAVYGKDGRDRLMQIIGRHRLDAIFGLTGDTIALHGKPIKAVTPADVADQLETWLNLG